MTSILALIGGFGLDLLIGDPYSFPHPIRLIGHMIHWGEKQLRKTQQYSPKQLKQRGGLLTLSITLTTFLVSFILLKASYLIHPFLGFCVEMIMYYQIFATKCLKVESMKVYDALKKGNLTESREKVAMIVGRDTMQLDAEGIAKATIETVAENTTDGVIAPLFFCVLGGAPLGFWYKAVNTLDSMIGYKNEQYRDFGYYAAHLDDVANFIPARLAALLMIIASGLGGYDAKQAWKIFKRDRYNHKSPNSAQTESVCAGALGIQLAGNAYYFGQIVEKPTIGDSLQAASYEAIRKVNHLLYLTAFLGVGLGVCVRLMM